MWDFADIEFSAFASAENARSCGDDYSAMQRVAQNQPFSLDCLMGS